LSLLVVKVFLTPLVVNQKLFSLINVSGGHADGNSFREICCNNLLAVLFTSMIEERIEAIKRFARYLFALLRFWLDPEAVQTTYSLKLVD